MDHSVKGRRQALHQTHHHYYLNISVEAANLSDWRIESNRKKIDSVARIESNRIETFLPELECSSIGLVVLEIRRGSAYTFAAGMHAVSLIGWIDV